MNRDQFKKIRQLRDYKNFISEWKVVCALYRWILMEYVRHSSRSIWPIKHWNNSTANLPWKLNQSRAEPFWSKPH